MFTHTSFLASLYAAASVATFLLFLIDKIEARHHGDRISESVLLVASFVGGWPGALLAQRTFRHKLRKPSFQWRFWSIVICHITVVGGLLYLT